MTGDVDANSEAGSQQGATPATTNHATGSQKSLPQPNDDTSTQMQPIQQQGEVNTVNTKTRDSGSASEISAIATMTQNQQHQGQRLPAPATEVHPRGTGTVAARSAAAAALATASQRAGITGTGTAASTEASATAAGSKLVTQARATPTNAVGVKQPPMQQDTGSRATSSAQQVEGAKASPPSQGVGFRSNPTQQAAAARPNPHQPPVGSWPSQTTLRTSPPQQMGGYDHQQPQHSPPNLFQQSNLVGVGQALPVPVQMVAGGQPRYSPHAANIEGAPPNAPGQRQFKTSPDQAAGAHGGQGDFSVPYAIEARAAAAAAAYRSQNPIESAKHQMLLPADITTAAAAAAAARRQSEGLDMSHWPIVEEDPLPIYFRAIDGIGSASAEGLRRKRKEEWKAAVAIPIPPRMVGSLREHDVQSGKACNCKNSACLKLYCECFSSGLLCTSACTCDNHPGTEKQCRNNHENLSVRHLSIIQAIQRNPHHFSQNMNPISLSSPQSSTTRSPKSDSQTVDVARRTAADDKKRTCNCTKSKCLKMYCECFSSGVTCSKNCKCSACENIPGNALLARTLAKKRKKSTTHNAIVLAPSGLVQGKSGTTAATSASVAPVPKPPPATKPLPRARPALLQGGRPIHGIAFFPADVKGASLSQQKKKKKTSESPRPNRLHHDLMLAPSALLTGSDGTAPSRSAAKALMMTAFASSKGSGLFGSRPSELEEAWDNETAKVTTFFAQMRRQLDAKVQGSGRTKDQQHSSSANGTSATNPANVLRALQEDVKALHNVAQTAQVEAHVSLREDSRRDARWWQGKRAAVVAKLNGQDRKRAGDELWCDEDFDEGVEKPKVSNVEETMDAQRLRDLVVRAAIDTALLRETARIVRSKARELARKRMKTGDEVKR